MALVSWQRKSWKDLKCTVAKRLLPPRTTLKTSPKCILPSQAQTTFKTSPKCILPSQVVLSADLRCIKCQERVAAVASAINLESIVVHVREKKVELTRKTINH
ncbi:uncharacterized protein LOC105158034 isoform X2 [Sesamum indicum]|uniref:Uncharacterized protein LOC105158034 isoform X2 n=1 Tax=Sesamum indicum TaxID=4182 RepID=A0A6I9SSG8_SESIN|nr:uncharacterized protein LOC105158034 isoform X2 [Sesamum indicum]